MTKQEIHNAIHNSPLVKHILEENMIEEIGIVRTYEYVCIIGSDISANRERLSFYVLNEGQPTETAYFRPGMYDKINPVVEESTTPV